MSMLKVKQLSKTDLSEYDVKCDQSMIAHRGKGSCKHNEVNFFSSSQDRGKGGRFTRKAIENYCQ